MGHNIMLTAQSNITEYRAQNSTAAIERDFRFCIRTIIISYIILLYYNLTLPLENIFPASSTPGA